MTVAILTWESLLASLPNGTPQGCGLSPELCKASPTQRTILEPRGVSSGQSLSIGSSISAFNSGLAAWNLSSNS